MDYLKEIEKLEIVKKSHLDNIKDKQQDIKDIQSENIIIIDTINKYTAIHKTNLENSKLSAKLLGGKTKQSMYEILTFVLHSYRNRDYYLSHYGDVSIEKLIRDVTFFDFLIVELGVDVIKSITNKFDSVKVVNGEPRMCANHSIKNTQNSENGSNFTKKIINKITKKSVITEVNKRIALMKEEPEDAVPSGNYFKELNMDFDTNEVSSTTLKNLYKLTKTKPTDIVVYKNDQLPNVERVNDSNAHDYIDNIFIKADDNMVVYSEPEIMGSHVEKDLVMDIFVSKEFLQTKDILLLFKTLNNLYDGKLDGIQMIIRGINISADRHLMVDLSKLYVDGGGDIFFKELKLALEPNTINILTQRINGNVILYGFNSGSEMVTYSNVYFMLGNNTEGRLMAINSDLFIKELTKEEVDVDYKFKSTNESINISIRKIINYRISDFFNDFETKDDLIVDINKYLKEYIDFGITYDSVNVVVKFLTNVEKYYNDSGDKGSQVRKYMKLNNTVLKHLNRISISYIVRDDDYIHSKSPHDRSGHWRTYKSGKVIWIDTCTIHKDDIK